MNSYIFLTQKDMLILKPQGEITMRAYPEFEKNLTQDITPGMKLIVNLEGVEFVDSQGIIFLLRLRQIAEINNVRFMMYNLNYQIDKVITRLRLDRILNVAKNTERCFLEIGENKVSEECGLTACAF